MTFNIENIRSNHHVISDELDDIDLLLIQEHWLYTFEQDELTRNISNWHYCARSVDEYEGIAPTSRPQGHGGIAILWRPELTPYIRKLEDGNERILPILVEAEFGDLVLINCYLPSGNSKDACRKLKSDIAVLEEIVKKYSNSHSVIVCGDLNV